MDYDYITDQAVKLQQFQDGESVKKDETPAQKLPSTQLIQETLAYAKELERIV